MNLKKGLLLSLLSFLLTLLFLEGILRLTTDMKHIRYKCHYPMLGNQYCKNVVATHPESGNTIISNSHGLLDKEYPVVRTTGTLRIAMIGDSFVAGEEIKFGSTFHEIWEQQLPELLGMPVEILNFGVSGTGTWKQLQTFHLRVRDFKPDITVLVFYWGNDLIDALGNSKKGYANPLLDEYPVDSWSEKFKVMHRRFNQALWNNSALYQFVRTRFPEVKRRLHSLIDPTVAALRNAQTEKVTYRRITPPKPEKDMPSWLDDLYFMDSPGWQLSQKLILKLHDEARASGSSLIVLHFLSQQHFAEELTIPTDAFNDFLRRNSIPYIDPNPYFLQLAPERLHALYIPNDIHFNEKGHELLAHITLNQLAAELSHRLR